MKKFTSLFFAVMLIFSLTACKKDSPELISDKEAKDAIMLHIPDAIITECIYNSNTQSYEIEYKTSHNVYIAIVNAITGNINSVTIKEEIQEEDSSYFEESETNTDTKFISAETALSIALADSNISGTASLVKNELNRESETYTVVFRAGNREYTYIIYAVSGKILLSETEIDS